MRQPHQPPLPNTTLQICIAPKTEPLVVVCAYDRLTELSDRQGRGFELSEATRPALGSLLTSVSWHDELSAKELEVGRDLPSLHLKSMPKSCELLGDCTLTETR